jgi:hypothetical protein
MIKSKNADYYQGFGCKAMLSMFDIETSTVFSHALPDKPTLLFSLIRYTHSGVLYLSTGAILLHSSTLQSGVSSGLSSNTHKHNGSRYKDGTCTIWLHRDSPRKGVCHNFVHVPGQIT